LRLVGGQGRVKNHGQVYLGQPTRKLRGFPPGNRNLEPYPSNRWPRGKSGSGVALLQCLLQDHRRLTRYPLCALLLEHQ